MESDISRSAHFAKGMVLVLASLAAFALVLGFAVVCLFLVHPGDAITALPEDNQSEDLSAAVSAFADTLERESLQNLPVAQPAEETEEEAILPVETAYTIPTSATAGNVPNPDCYGSSDDPEVIEAVIASAADLLDGQEVVWNRDRNFWQGTVTRWYYDETILVLSWTEYINGALCYNSEVKVADASQFRRALVGNTYGAGQQLLCSKIAESCNAVLASNADFYSFRSSGINVYRGRLYRCVSGLENCFIDENGDLLVTHKEELTTEEETQQFIEENHINFSLSFGPILVENGAKQATGYYPIGQITDRSARAMLCQMDSLHYLVSNVNYATILELADIAEFLQPEIAYTIDGGQTGETILGGTILNEIVYHAERTVSDIIYFATAYPWEEEEAQ